MPAEQTPADVLPGTRWHLVALDGLPVEDHSLPVLEFQTDAIRGHGGCNRYSAAGALDGDTLRVGPITATRRACEPRILERELRYFELLESAQHVEIVGDFLVVYCTGAAEPLRFAAELGATTR